MKLTLSTQPEYSYTLIIQTSKCSEHQTEKPLQKCSEYADLNNLSISEQMQNVILKVCLPKSQYSNEVQSPIYVSRAMIICDEKYILLSPNKTVHLQTLCLGVILNQNINVSHFQTIQAVRREETHKFRACQGIQRRINIWSCKSSLDDSLRIQRNRHQMASDPGNT